MFKVALPCALLLLGSQAGAVVLGSVQGQLLIGRPFDVLVQTRIEPGQGLADLCLQTELVFGTAVQPTDQLAVSVHTLGTDGALKLRLRSNELVNEPIVTLHLKVGCQAVFSRSYTLLADIEAVPLLPAAPVDQAMAAPGTLVGAQAAPALAGQAQWPTPVSLHPPRARPAQVAGVRSKTAVRALAPAAAAAALAAAVPTAPPSVPIAGARLQLDPVPLAAAVPQVPPVPEATPTVVTPIRAVSDPMPAAPELEVLRAENERLRLALESALAQRPAEAPAALTPAASAWPWLSAAAALALLVLASLGYLLRTGRLMWVPGAIRAPAWLSTLSLRSPRERAQPDTVFAEVETHPGNMRAGDGPSAPSWAQSLKQAERSARAGLDAPKPAPTAVAAPQARAAAVGAAPAQARGSAGATAAAALEATQTADSVGPAGAASAAAPSAAPFWEGYDLAHGLEVADGRASMFAEVPIAALNPAQLLEAWQQADFFESIAQPQQAMQVLAAFIQEHPRASEAPYLRWLWLEALAGGVADAGLAARCYENHFQRMAPTLAAFAGTEGLENDSAWMGKLQARWPLLPARELLQQALASQPGEEALPGALKLRSLAAFDDLILLLALLDTLDQTSVEAPVLAALTLPPLAAAPPVAAAPAAQGTERDPMWIDFDLSHLDAVSAQPAPSGAAVPAKPNQSALPPAVG